MNSHERFVMNDGKSTGWILVITVIYQISFLINFIQTVGIFSKIGKFGKNFQNRYEQFGWIFEHILIYGFLFMICFFLPTSLYFNEGFLLFWAFLCFLGIIQVPNILHFFSKRNMIKQKANEAGNSKFTAISSLKSNILLSTIFFILAVDYPLLPRFFAKTYIFGISVMDVGATCFLLLNATLSSEARCKSSSKLNIIESTKKSIAKCFPLLLIGFGRTVIIKLIGYYEVEHEYGLHMNFFLVLALVKIISSVIFAGFSNFINVDKLGIIISIIYEISLQMGVSEILQINGHRNGNIIYANREGLFTLPQNIAMYLIFVGWTKFIHTSFIIEEKDGIMARERLFRHFAFRSLGCLIWSFFLHFFFQPCSRRILNGAFAFGMLSLVSSLFALQYKYEIQILKYIPKIKGKESRLVDGLSSNGIHLFLIANLLTGLFNTLQSTQTMNTLGTVCSMCVYITLISICRELLQRRMQTIK